MNTDPVLLFGAFLLGAILAGVGAILAMNRRSKALTQQAFEQGAFVAKTDLAEGVKRGRLDNHRNCCGRLKGLRQSRQKNWAKVVLGTTSASSKNLYLIIEVGADDDHDPQELISYYPADQIKEGHQVVLRNTTLASSDETHWDYALMQLQLGIMVEPQDKIFQSFVPPGHREKRRGGMVTCVASGELYSAERVADAEGGGAIEPVTPSRR